MGELDDEWNRRLAEAEQRARRSGRGDVINYLNLRTANDEARGAGIGWLLESFTTRAGELNRGRGGAISVERREEHRFQTGSSTMVGPSLTLRVGVRSISVEAGWPRAPQDGIVRGGGLAAAQILHFGNSRLNEQLLLTRDNQPQAAPQWIAVEFVGGVCRRLRPFREEHALTHLVHLL